MGVYQSTAHRSLRRTAAFRALWKALTAGTRGGPPLGARLAALPRMAAASLRGEYDGAGRALLMAMATAYVLSPLDAVPELFLTVVGLVDDAVVVTWLAGAVLDETGRFLEWERRRAGTIDAEVVADRRQ